MEGDDPIKMPTGMPIRITNVLAISTRVVEAKIALSNWLSPSYQAKYENALTTDHGLGSLFWPTIPKPLIRAHTPMMKTNVPMPITFLAVGDSGLWGFKKVFMGSTFGKEIVC